MGLGFPYEGPAPLEAIADGAVFLNPVFKKDSQLFKEASKFYEVSVTVDSTIYLRNQLNFCFSSSVTHPACRRRPLGATTNSSLFCW